MGVAIRWSPFRALGVLVAGMSVHNFVVMVLLALQAPVPVVRVVQAWKELVLVVVGAFVLWALWRAWRSGARPRLVAADVVAAAFAVLLVVLLVLPVGGGPVQRLFAFRPLALLPLLYLFGRVVRPSRADLRWTLGLIAGSACLVVVLGLVELWFVPTWAWVAMGANLLSAFNGQSFSGPGGLPENFVQATSAGPFLRRMVSTYVSPLGVAYVGLLVMPAVTALWVEREPDRRWRALGWAAVVLVTVGVVLSVTRLAVALLVPEMALLALLLRQRLVVAAVPAVAVAAAFGLFAYVYVGPTIRHDLTPIRQPAGYAVLVLGGAPAQAGIVITPAPARTPARAVAAAASPRPSATPRPKPRPTPTPRGSSIVLFPGDTSVQGHSDALHADVDLLLHHPLGLGLGTFAPRFAQAQDQDLGESAVFGVFDQGGIPLGLLYLAMYALMLLNGWRALRRAHGWEERWLPLVALVGGLALVPITLTSDVWTGLAVTFLPWWAAGYCATAARPE